MEGKLNAMCVNCGHYEAGRCSGTHSQVWTGCCGKNLEPDEFDRYVDSIEKDIDEQLKHNRSKDKHTEAADRDTLEALDSMIYQQAAEACTDPRDLTEEQIINNRFL